MSQTPAAAAASSHFQTIFDAALKLYEKRTKKDLITHPLSSQLQACDSTTAILAVLQDQIREFDKSHSGDERLTKWLTPTVNVLCAFSAAISGGVGLVSPHISPEASSDIYIVGIFTRNRDLFRCRCLHISKYPIYFFRWVVLTLRFL